MFKILEMFIKSDWIACLINSWSIIIMALIFINHKRIESKRKDLLLDEINVRTIQNNLLLKRIEKLEKKVEPIEPTEPTESIEPTEPIEFVNTVDFIESTESTESTELVNSTEYIELIESTALYKSMEGYCEQCAN